MKIYTISTLHDWAHFTGAAGPVGIERIFDLMVLARIERVYWRVFEGGLATYPSSIATVFKGRDVAAWQNLGDGGGTKSEQWAWREDCSTWDPLATAVAIAHRRGIELCAWWTLCEEDHGGHILSRFGQKKAFRQQDREGRDHPGTAELLLPEVQEYRLKILDEILERGVDGLLLDFVRNNATPGGDSRGINRFGYNQPIRRAYKHRYGVDPIKLPADDPQWLAFKNQGRADFVRKIRQRQGKEKHLALMTIPHVDNRTWLCLDLPALSADGTVDLVMPFGMSYCNSPETTALHVQQLKQQVRGGRTQVAAGIQGYWGITPDAYDAALSAADRAGAKATVLYEADMISRMNLLTPTRAWHLQAPRRDRAVEVPSIGRTPTEADWKRAARHNGFFMVTGPDQSKPTAPTSFQVLAGSGALHVRIHAAGVQKDTAPDLLYGRQVYLDWLGARTFWERSDKVHLLIDAAAARNDYIHFSGSRSGQQATERRFSNPLPLSPKQMWGLKITQPSRRLWTAEFAIPYRLLGGRPRSGSRWGFQIVREHCATREVSSWFVSTAYGVDPLEWGDMHFQ